MVQCNVGGTKDTNMHSERIEKYRLLFNLVENSIVEYE